MSVKELSALLFNEGFRMVGKSSWEMGRVSISLSNGFLYVIQIGVGTLKFPFREDDEFNMMVIDGNLAIWWNDMVYTHKI